MGIRFCAKLISNPNFRKPRAAQFRFVAASSDSADSLCEPEYVSFERGKLAAVKMLNHPPFFASFAASIRHFEIDENNSEIIYKVNFTAKPRWLRPFLYPIMRAVLVWETRKRLKALKVFFQTRSGLQ